MAEALPEPDFRYCSKAAAGKWRASSPAPKPLSCGWTFSIRAFTVAGRTWNRAIYSPFRVPITSMASGEIGSEDPLVTIKSGRLTHKARILRSSLTAVYHRGVPESRDGPGAGLSVSMREFAVSSIILPPWSTSEALRINRVENGRWVWFDAYGSPGYNAWWSGIETSAQDEATSQHPEDGKLGESTEMAHLPFGHAKGVVQWGQANR